MNTGIRKLKSTFLITLLENAVNCLYEVYEEINAIALLQSIELGPKHFLASPTSSFKFYETNPRPKCN